MSPYQILGISEGASPEEIKKAWKRKAQETHPDKHPGDPSAQARFMAVRQAYDQLSSPKPTQPVCATCGANLVSLGHPCSACRHHDSAMEAMRQQQALIRKQLREQEIACYRRNQYGLENEFGWLGDWSRRGVPKWWKEK